MDELTVENLVCVPFAPDETKLQAEILKLSDLIDSEPLGERHTDLCAAFRALQWARNPTAFSAPSEWVMPEC